MTLPQFTAYSAAADRRLRQAQVRAMVAARSAQIGDKAFGKMVKGLESG